MTEGIVKKFHVAQIVNVWLTIATGGYIMVKNEGSGAVMTTKDIILKALDRAEGNYVSGEALSAEAGVSRTAVWNAVNALRKEGLEIEAVQNRGYSLRRESVSVADIERYAKGSYDVRVLNSATSTNDVCKTLAAGGAAEGTVVVAREQSLGRGRMGRAFFSPKGSGVYFSFILRPDAEKVGMLTVMAAVAVAEGIESIGGKSTSIKWVNDVYVDGKKCCGILSEAAVSLEGGGVDYAVVGIGINVTTPEGGFPDSLKDIAAAACDGVEGAPSRLIAAVLDLFFDMYMHFDPADVARRYRARSFLTGRSVMVIRGDSSRRAVVLGIDDECHLHVRYDDGEEAKLSSGEVSLKLGN